jgi:hypothetical protein
LPSWGLNQMQQRSVEISPSATIVWNKNKKGSTW